MVHCQNFLTNYSTSKQLPQFCWMAWFCLLVFKYNCIGRGLQSTGLTRLVFQVILYSMPTYFSFWICLLSSVLVSYLLKLNGFVWLLNLFWMNQLSGLNKRLFCVLVSVFFDLVDNTILKAFSSKWTFLFRLAFALFSSHRFSFFSSSSFFYISKEERQNIINNISWKNRYIFK